MDDLGSIAGPPASNGNAPRDGTIEFSGYSDAQLNELQYTVDGERYPKNYENLLAEIARRHSARSADAPSTDLILARFTRYDGLRGWLEAKTHGSSLYGSGSIEFLPHAAILNGWQRTWLGSSIQAQVILPHSGIRNVANESGKVRFEFKRAYLPARQFVVTPAAVERVDDLISRLPVTTTPGFERRWKEIREFNARLRQAAKRPVVTPCIVAANVLLFVIMCVATKQVGQFTPVQLITWGSDFGPLTVNGQWWRLLTATFIHLNVMHLLVNMWVLWNIGRICEQVFGRGGLVFLYFASAVLASFSSIAWNPDVNTVGASGAIFGILGAFLSFFLNPRNHVPAALARRQWISTGAFALFNLGNGAFQPGIDNAAHVGGLIAGLGLGWIMARPLDNSGRSAIRAARRVIAAVFLALLSAMAVWQVKGLGSELTEPERFYRSHPALVRDEADNLKLWNELATRAAAGSISDSELSARFEHDIVPFWQAAQAQLDKEDQAPSGKANQYEALFLDVVKARLEWAEKVADGLNHPDPDFISEITKLISKTNAAQARVERIQIRATMDHRPRALANSPAVAAIRRLYNGNLWTCIYGSSDTPRPKAPAETTDGPAARSILGCRAQSLFMSGDYRQLDSLIHRYSLTLGDLPDGGSSYDGVFRGLTDLFDDQHGDALQFLGRTSDWRRSDRSTRTPDVLEALILEGSAWSARGHGFAASISAQQSAQFAYRTEMAAAALADTADVALTSPIWYRLSLDIGLDQNLDVDELKARFDLGYATFPTYQALERRMLRILMPRWRGSYQEVDKFINAQYQASAPQTGFEHYAELYTDYADLEGDTLDLFSDTAAFWSGMRSGYLGLVKRHPTSDVVLNEFANIACRAGDGVQYAALRKSLSTRYSADAWSDKYSLKSCDDTFASEALARTQRAATAPVIPVETPFESLGGARLGMSPTDLFEIKGSPLREPFQNWSYALGGPTHHGVLMAVFSPATDTADPTLISVEFTGDEGSAPPEVPFLNGLSESDLKDRFGYLVGMGSPADGVTRLEFKNGVYADLRDGRAFRYGIYTVSAATKPASPITTRP